jgi:hypothetical protein
MNVERRRAHIKKFGRAFLPEERMRHIRWEEAVLRSRVRRKGGAPFAVAHTSCLCGSVECLAIPYARPLEPAPVTFGAAR